MAYFAENVIPKGECCGNNLRKKRVTLFSLTIFRPQGSETRIFPTILSTPVKSINLSCFRVKNISCDTPVAIISPEPVSEEKRI